MSSEIKVIIDWEKKCDDWEKDYKKLTLLKGVGLYQITGYHPVFGDDSLLYIGMAGKKEAREFKNRFIEHTEWLNKEYDLKVYIGKISEINDVLVKGKKTTDELREIIHEAEKLLIYFHSPPYNSREISNPPKGNLRIINIGNCGDLYPEVSHIGLSLYG